MLHRERLLTQVTQQAAQYSRSVDAYQKMLSVWPQIAQSDAVIDLCDAGPLHCTEALGWRERIAPQTSYQVVGIDGSQVYPNRHEGLAAFLINIGHASLSYSSYSTATLESFPYFFSGLEASEYSLTEAAVSSMRTAYEYSHATSCAADLIIFDGSLYLWHLMQSGPLLREEYACRYVAHLLQLYDRRIPWCGFVSAPYSRDMVSLAQEAISQNIVQEDPSIADHIHDAVLMGQMLNPGERSQILYHDLIPCAETIPDQIRPHFLYMHTGTEIARIELPAWVASDQELCAQVLRIVYDQCIKGRGYPVCLCEAHEQAVVSERDRQLFYQIVRSQLKRSGIIASSSQKFSSKQRAPI